MVAGDDLVFEGPDYRPRTKGVLSPPPLPWRVDTACERFGYAVPAALEPDDRVCTHQVTQVSGRQTSGGGLRHAEHAMLVSQRLPSVHGLTLRLGQRSVQSGTAPPWTA